MPFSGGQEETPAEEAATMAVEAPEVTDERDEEISIPVPPGLVESAPVSGSTVAFDQNIVLYFNQPMNDQSVIDHITFEPSMDVNYVWVDESTLEITPVEIGRF